MGSSHSKQESLTRNKQIDVQLKRDRKDAKKRINILLLGTGESGKSTVLKQMKLTYDGEYNDPERVAYREIVFDNTVQCMSVVIQALSHLDLVLSPENELYVPVILNPEQTWREQPSLPVSIADALSALWRDPAIQAAVKRSREFQVNDSATYFFDSVERFAAPGYLPTNQDILRSRVKTSGVTEVLFDVRGLEYKVLDVGGQRSERRKWIHCFENVTALIFVVSLSEYDQVLYEDESVNRVVEAINLFDATTKSQWFAKSSVILFLNKIDLFRSKLSTSPIKAYFPRYAGSDDGSEADFNVACDFFRAIFVSSSSLDKRLVAHFTCATDSKQIRVVIHAINEHILRRNLEDGGFM